MIVKSFDKVEQIHIVSHATINRISHSDKGDDLNGTTTKKILLNIRIKNEEDVLVISCTSFSMAQSVADLIDGYHRMATNCATSIWLNVNSGKLGMFRVFFLYYIFVIWPRFFSSCLFSPFPLSNFIFFQLVEIDV